MRITIKYVNQPREATGKFGSIRGGDGTTIWVPVGQLGQFREGQTYDVPTEARTWGQGDKARPVNVAAGPGMPVGFINQAQPAGYAQANQQHNQQSADGAYGYAGQQAQGSPPGGFPPSDAVGARTAPTPPPAALPAPPAATYKLSMDSRSIFATGIVGRAMGSGKFAASEIGVLLEGALEAWDKQLDPIAPPPDDGIPY